MQRHSVTSIKTVRSLASGPRGSQLSFIYGSSSGVSGRSLTAGKILFTGRQKCSLYLVLWLCGQINRVIYFVSDLICATIFRNIGNILNSTTREMISDIFFNKLFKQVFKNIFFIFRQIFTNNSIRNWIEITLDIQNDIHDTRTRKNYFYQEKENMKWNKGWKWLVYVCNLVYYFHLKSFIPFHIFFFLIKIIFSCSCIMDIILYI